jgi:hypothetical protein
MLEAAGFIRRVPVPGRRGRAYEVTPDAILRTVAAPAKFQMFREPMDRGLALKWPARPPYRWRPAPPPLPAATWRSEL